MSPPRAHAVQAAKAAAGLRVPRGRFLCGAVECEGAPASPRLIITGNEDSIIPISRGGLQVISSLPKFTEVVRCRWDLNYGLPAS